MLVLLGNLATSLFLTAVLLEAHQKQGMEDRRDHPILETTSTFAGTRENLGLASSLASPATPARPLPPAQAPRRPGPVPSSRRRSAGCCYYSRPAIERPSR